MPHLCTIPIVEKEIINLNHQPGKWDGFYCFFKWANTVMATPPPLAKDVGLMGFDLSPTAKR